MRASERFFELILSFILVQAQSIKAVMLLFCVWTNSVRILNTKYVE